MKFSTITISALSIIASAHARRRHLNIKGEESDASMSMIASSLYAAKGGSSSKSKSAPTSAPTPEVCDVLLLRNDDMTMTISYSSTLLLSYDHSLVNVIL